MTSSLFLLLALVLPALTLAIDLKPYNETAHGMFISTDSNMDGVLSRDELDATFKGYDTNGDGRVSRHEYTSFVDLHSPTLHSLSHALYDIYDVDGDHHLDKHDYDNFYALIDGDGDGTVEEIEFIKYWSVLFVNLEHLHGHNGR
ncbi:uncharacterized protein LOC101845039 [Aplysia californica]|uniref:Uncharacterized protein LOC101845039 n=1 Tax=Aplysia californica TaxID=6500 RepID=A0ABM1AAA6_APLCA|nr:uncharacterized protein LOC101845039 [Aplysia californica]